MKNKYKALTLLFVLIALSLSSVYIFLPKQLQALDNKVRDFYFEYRGETPADENIIIVDIDDRSIKKLGQWPWERDKIAQILNNLTQNAAGIIGLDVIFSEVDKSSPKKIAIEWGLDTTNLPDYDTILANTIATTPTILGYVFDFEVANTNEAPTIFNESRFTEKNRLKQEFLSTAIGVHTNLNAIQESAYSSGFFNNIPDSDGIIRSVPLMIKYSSSEGFAKQIYPSLAFEMYLLASSSKIVKTHYSEATNGVEYVQVDDKIIPTDTRGRLHINFRGSAKSYKYISALDIYNNTIKKEQIAGKFIFIGTSAYGLNDLRATPMDSVYPGVEVHATVLDNLLHDDMFIKVKIDLLVTMVIAFIAIFIFSHFSLLSIGILYNLLFVSFISLNYYLLFVEFITIDFVLPLASFTLSFVGTLAINYILEQRQKELVKSSFSKKVSKQVMDDLLSNSESSNFASKEVETTIYFSDIRSFTTISEELKSPKRITDFLNFYMNAMVESVEKNQGTIDKFIGDAIMAYWNAPLEVKNHADKAVLTALEQIAKRDELNKTIKKDFGFDVDYGIGINTGDVVVGEIGSHGRSDYTIIGDSVNLASRLEGLCKPYKVRLVISEFTKKQLTQEYVIQLLDIVRVKGKTEPVKIYEVLSQGQTSQSKLTEITLYNEAHSLYLNADFTQALNSFNILYEKYGKFLYSLYATRCQELLNASIKEFDGVYEFTTK